MSNKTLYYNYKLYSIILYGLPLGTLFAVNHAQYIKDAGSSLGFFGFILLSFFGVATKSKLQEVAKKNTLLTFSVVVFAVSFVMRFLADQMLLISGASVLGCVFSSITEQVADVYYSRAYKTDTAGKKMKIRTVPLSQKEAWMVALKGFEVEKNG